MANRLSQVRPIPNKPIEERRADKKQRDENIADTIQQSVDRLKEQRDKMYETVRTPKKGR